MHRGGVSGYSLRGIDDVLEGRSRRLRRFVVVAGAGCFQIPGTQRRVK
jgi:hypothetical protein